MLFTQSLIKKILSRFSPKICVFLVVLFCAYFLPVLAFADTHTSVGTGNWGTAGTWDVNAVPANGDTVVINGYNVTIAANTLTVANVTINSGGTLTMGSAIVLNMTGTFTNNGTLAANAASIISCRGTSCAIATGTGTGNFGILTTMASVSSTLAINTSTTTANLQISTTTPATGIANIVNLGAGITLNVTGNVSMTRPASATSTLAVGSATLNVTGNLTLAASTAAGRGNEVTLSTGTITVGGNITTAGYCSQVTFTGNGTINIAGTFMSGTKGTLNMWSGGTVNFTGAGANLGSLAYVYNNLTYSGSGDSTASAAVTIRGNLTGTNGAIKFGTQAVTIGTSTVDQTIAGFTTTGTVSMTKTGGTATVTGNVSGGALTINGVGGTLNLGTGLSHTFTGVVTLTNGTLDGGSSTINVNAISTTAWNGTGTNFTANASTVVFGANGNQTHSASATTFYNLTLQGNGLKTLTNIATVSHDFTANASTSGMVIATIGGDFSVGGSNAAQTVTTGANLTVTGNTTINTAGTVTQGAFTFSTTNLTVTSGTLTTANGAFTVNGATLVNGGTLTLNNDTGIKRFVGGITVNSGTLNGASQNIQVEGGITHGGGSVAITGGLTFQATASQAISGTIAIASTTINSGITLTNSGTFASSATTTVRGAFVNNGTVNATAMNGAGSWTQGANSTLNTTGNGVYAMGITTVDFSSNTNTVNYSGTAQTLKQTTYNSLSLSGSGVKTMTGVTVVNANFVIAGSATATSVLTTVGGNFDVDGTAQLTLGAANLQITGNLTIGDGSGAWLRTGANTLGVTGATTIAASAFLDHAGAGAVTFTGDLSVAGCISLVTGCANASVGAGQITASGNVTGNGTITLSGGIFEVRGTKNFGGDTAWTFKTLYIGNGAAANTTGTGSGNITATTGITIGSSSTLNAGAKNYLLSAAGTPLVVTAGGTFNKDTSTVSFTANGAQNVPALNYNNLSLLTGGLKTFASGTTGIAGALTITTATTDATTNSTTISFNGAGAQAVNAINYYNLTLDTSGLKTFASGTIGIANALTVSGSATTDATTNSSTVSFNKVGDQNVNALNYYNLTLATSGAKTFASGTIGIANALSLTGSATANATANSTTVSFNKAGDQAINAISYHNLTLAVSGVKTFASGTTNIAGSLSLSGTATADATTNTTVINYNGTGGTVGPITYYDLTLSGSGTKTLTGVTTINHNLALSGTASATLAADMTVGGTVSIGSGTTLDQGTSYTLQTGGNLSVASGGNLTNTGTGDLTLGGDVSNEGTITIDGSGVGCPGADTILIHSTDTTKRSWSGGGTFNITDADVDYQNGSVSIIVLSGTDGGHNGANWNIQTGCVVVANITVSGIIFDTDGSTPLTNQPNMQMAVGGTSTSTGTVLSNGAFSFSHTPPSAGDVITVWLNTNGGDQASLIFKYGSGCAGGNCTGLSLMKNKVIILNKHSGNITNSDLSACNNTVGVKCSDTDIGISTASGLATTWTTNVLQVASSTIFVPGGSVTAQKLEAEGTYTGGGGGAGDTLTLSGSGIPLVVGAVGAFTAPDTVKYTGGSAVTINTGVSYNNLEVSPSADGSTPTFANSNSGAPSSADWYSTGGTWGYRKAITIDKTKVAYNNVGEMYNSFPVLISLTEADLKFTDSGGNVASSTAGDILFTASDGVTKLNHEIEKYASTTGELISWVNTGTSGLSTTTDTTIYMYYGNATSPYEPNPTAVWDANYKGVWHLTNGTNLTANDSTGNSVTGTVNGNTTATTGVADGGASFPGADATDNINYGNVMKGMTAFTIQAWAKPHGDGSSFAPFMEDGSGSTVYKGLGFAQNPGTDYYKLVGRVRVNGSILNVTSDSSHKLTADAWNFVTMTYDDNTDKIIYIHNNASSYGQSSAGSGTISDDSSGSYTWRSGTTPGTGFSKYQGVLDEIRVSNIVRSVDWLATEYANQSATSTFYKSIGTQETPPATITISRAFNVGDGTHNSTVNLPANFNLVGDVTVNSGTLDLSAHNNTLATPGTVTIGANGTLKASATKPLYIKNNFTNNGAFTHNGGTVVVATTTSGATITIGGSSVTAFNNFTATSSSATTLKFKSGATFSFSGLLDLVGTAEKPLMIESDNDSVQWFLNLTGSQNVRYVSIRNAGCGAGSVEIPSSDFIYDRGGNGTCWGIRARGGGGVAFTAVDNGNGGGTAVVGGPKSDSFTGDDATPLATHDPNWVSMDATYVVGNLQINGNQVRTTGAWSQSGAMYSTSNSDTSQIVVKPYSDANTYKKVCVRAGLGAGAEKTGYCFKLVAPVGGNWTYLNFSKNGSYLGDGLLSSYSQATDHTLKITASGTSSVTLTAYVDGVLAGTYVDSSSPIGLGGHPGFEVAGNGDQSITYFDDWTDDATVTQGGGGTPVDTGSGGGTPTGGGGSQGGGGGEPAP